MSAVFYMAVGLPGAGKSTLYKSHYSHAVYISSDEIRQEVFGDVNDQEHNAEVFDIMRKRVIENLKANKSVYYDATNISAKRRIAFLNSISFIPNIVKICLLVVPPFDKVKNQNMGRDKVVPEYVLDRMLKNFDVPHKSEGWNTIRIYGNEPSDYCSNLANELEAIPHDNPHHTDTIGSHMYNAAMFMECEYPLAKPYMMRAAYLHDLGKLYCKVFHNSKGEPTEDAHYYNHENVGAYFYLSNSWGSCEDLHVANLIRHHMDYFKGEKYLEKIRNRFGNDFMEELDMLHQADLMAH